MKLIEPPGAPELLYVRSVGDSELTVSWMSPSKTGGANITDYVIEKCEIISAFVKSDADKDSDKTYTVSARWVHHDTVDRYTLDCKLKNLTLGGLYSVRVCAENIAGRGPFAEIKEPVTARNLYSRPDAPEGPLRISNITRETCDASWHAPKYNGGSPVLSYFVEKRDIKENIWIKIARIDPDIRTLKIFNLVEGHEYEIRVSAENEYGKSDPLVSEKFKPLRVFGTLFFIYIIEQFDIFFNA